MTIDALLSRIDARPNGRDRWRCPCPVCGERNRSTLSIGVGDTGAVLLKCWKSGCSPEQIAAAVGLDIADLFPPREMQSGPAPCRRLISAAQALALLKVEALTVFVIGSAVNANRVIAADDWTRLHVAIARIQQLGAEVYS